MELILSRPGALRTFSSEWSMKWAPAIIAYCKRLKKKDSAVIINGHESSGYWQYLNIRKSTPLQMLRVTKDLHFSSCTFVCSQENK